jgi:hypothetical protein
MGWWNQNEQGVSFADAAEGDEMVWGDAPADVMGDAVDKIVDEFKQAWDRVPTKAEVRAGLEFTLGGFDDEERVAR